MSEGTYDDQVMSGAVNSSGSTTCGRESSLEDSCSDAAFINANTTERGSSNISAEPHSASPMPETDVAVFAGSIGGPMALVVLIVAILAIVFCRRQRNSRANLIHGRSLQTLTEILVESPVLGARPEFLHLPIEANIEAEIGSERSAEVNAEAEAETGVKTETWTVESETLIIKSVDELQELCTSFGRWHVLKELTIVSCSVTKLPDNFEKLTSLEKLTLRGLEGLNELCSSFGEWKALKELTIERCALTKLPDSFEKLTSLEKVTLSGLDSLNELCSSFGELRALKELTIECCALTKLPESFEKLTSLEKLIITSVDELKELCSSFGRWHVLKELTIASRALKKLPDSFETLTSPKNGQSALEVKRRIKKVINKRQVVHGCLRPLRRLPRCLCLQEVRQAANNLYSNGMLLPSELEKVLLKVNTATEAAQTLIDYIEKKDRLDMYNTFLEILQTELKRDDLVKDFMFTH